MQPDTTAIRSAVTELIRRTSSELPEDVLQALRAARSREKKGGRARSMLDILISNAGLARAKGAPMCQDTGTLTFYGRVPRHWDTRRLDRALDGAVRAATRRGHLRCNTIDALTERSIDGNVACGAPIRHWEAVNAKSLELRLLMKGGGCENVSAQYALPDTRLNAARDIEGVRRCVLDAVAAAQGHGCAPGILGVCIGGDRAQGYAVAKRQLLRPLADKAAAPRLADLERRVLREANTLGIGPMGLGGHTALLSVKITAVSRLPASCFVTVAYMCWALRRGGARIDASGKVLRWLS